MIFRTTPGESRGTHAGRTGAPEEHGGYAPPRSPGAARPVADCLARTVRARQKDFTAALRQRVPAELTRHRTYQAPASFRAGVALGAVIDAPARSRRLAAALRCSAIARGAELARIALARSTSARIARAWIALARGLVRGGRRTRAFRLARAGFATRTLRRRSAGGVDLRRRAARAASGAAARRAVPTIAGGTALARIALARSTSARIARTCTGVGRRADDRTAVSGQRNEKQPQDRKSGQHGKHSWICERTKVRMKLV